jgi:hypothetical protein
VTGRPERVWLDITGIVPGSDAAVFALALAPALRRLVDTILCIRRPGLVALGDSEARRLLTSVRQERWQDRILAALRVRGAMLPPRLRVALGRAVRLQILALESWRTALARTRHAPSCALKDKATVVAGEVLLMLAPAGDATRFQAGGGRLAVLLAELLPLCRPDRVDQGQARDAALWVRTTLPALDAAMVCTAEAEHVLQSAGAPARPARIEAAATVAALAGDGTAGNTVLALGEIGLGGNTATLLLAWRELLDDVTPGAGAASLLPTLVLAGPIGHLSTTIMAQLHNSARYGGTVRLVAYPSEARLAELLAASRFCICPAPHEAWRRGVIDSRAAGRCCLAATESSGATVFDPDNASALAAWLRTWLAEPPGPVIPKHRDWDAVAGEIMAVLAR